MAALTFGELCCAAFRCMPGDVDRLVFWRCLHSHNAVVARLLWWVHRDYFRPDLELIGAIKDADGMNVVHAEIRCFRYRWTAKGLWRSRLRLRISGQKLAALAAELFAQAARSGALLALVPAEFSSAEAPAATPLPAI